jgi:hypothetical protein
VSLDRATSTVRGYVTAVSRRHVLLEGNPLGFHPLVVQWLKGLKQMRSVVCPAFPTWRLEIVLQALNKEPYEPMKHASLKHVTLKTVFLVAITSARRVSELQALCYMEPYLVFRSGVVTLATNPEFIPKVNTSFHTKQLLQLPAFHEDADGSLRNLCVRRALKYYLERTLLYRRKTSSPQLFLTYGGGRCKKKGRPVSKTRISSWLVESIREAYESLGLEPPRGVKAHSTRAQATSWATLAGVEPDKICAAATWASGNTFARHYDLNLFHQADADFGSAVLRTANAASRCHKTTYRIPKKGNTK